MLKKDKNAVGVRGRGVSIESSGSIATADKQGWP